MAIKWTYGLLAACSLKCLGKLSLTFYVYGENCGLIFLYRFLVYFTGISLQILTLEILFFQLCLFSFQLMADDKTTNQIKLYICILVSNSLLGLA